MEKYIKKLYLDPIEPTFLGGINPIFKKAKKKYPKLKIADIKKFLSSQDVYTLHKPYNKYQRAKIIAV